MSEPSEKREYISPAIESLNVRQLLEAVGPVQGLSSGAESSASVIGKTNHRGGNGKHRGRGPR